MSVWSFTRGLENMPGADPDMTSDPTAALHIFARFDDDNSAPAKTSTRYPALPYSLLTTPYSL